MNQSKTALITEFMKDMLTELQGTATPENMKTWTTNIMKLFDSMHVITENEKIPYKWEAFSILKAEGKEDFWFRLANGFKNRDGSFSILFNALPVTRKIIFKPKKEQEGDDQKTDPTENW